MGVGQQPCKISFAPCMYVCRCRYACLCMCGSQKTLDVLFTLPAFSFETGFLSKPGPRLEASYPQPSSCFHLPQLVVGEQLTFYLTARILIQVLLFSRCYTARVIFLALKFFFPDSFALQPSLALMTILWHFLSAEIANTLVLPCLACFYLCQVQHYFLAFEVIHDII